MNPASTSPGTPGRAELHATAAARLAHAGQRYTASRRALVEVLAAAPGPLAIPEILGARAEMPQSSAYRNLTVLERAGVVHRIVTTGDFARYELAEELTDDHHHHLICMRCGSVADFSVPRRLESTLASALAQVGADTGFRPQQHRLDVVGLCSACT